jgi:hypothetical protein
LQLVDSIEYNAGISPPWNWHLLCWDKIQNFCGGMPDMKSSQLPSDPEIKRIRKVQHELRLIQKEDFKDEVCEVYDLLISSGMDPIEAIRKTRSALKAINYPNATYDVVMANLRASGRLRKHMHKKMQNGPI